MAARRPWSREEFILTLNLYLKMPFGQMNQSNPKVKNLAELLGRTNGSIAMRLVNFAACDPILQARGILGLQAGKSQCQPYWDEYMQDREKFVFESEKLLAFYQQSSVELNHQAILQGTENLVGEDKVREVKTRVNQDVFRQMVLANYNGLCAVSGINISELLVASHIIPWAESKEERLNPENGICLSSLYDRAFDQGFISFDNDYKMIISPQLEANADKMYYQMFFHPFEHEKMKFCDVNYLPKKEFLEWHRDVIFQK